jgi:SAM-dependent methyltransferase
MDEITWSRVVMNRDINRMAKEIMSKAKKLSVLEISGERWRVGGDNTKYRRVNYPEFDICNDTLEEKFDLVIAEMVLEHVKYPYRALKNIFNMIENGGYFLVSVPFLFPIHNHPIDCTRWSADGLKYFLEEIGFPLGRIYTSSWGNRDCLTEICDNQDAIVLFDGQSLDNEDKYPISVWGLAQKPLPIGGTT